MANILDLIGETYTPIRLSHNIYSTKEHDSLIIWTDTNSFYWYSKNFGGDAFTWLIQVNNYDKEIAREIALDYTDDTIKRNRKKTSPQYELYQISGKSEYHSYFKERGLTAQTVKHFNLEFDTQLNRAIIPIYQNKIKIGAIVRNVNARSKRERYKITVFTKRKPILWPIEPILTPIVFEGCWSAMRFWQVCNQQFPDYSYHAILGAYPSKHLRELFNGLVPIFILDNDDAGTKMLEHLDAIGLKYKHFIPSIYPDELSDKQILKVMERIINV